MLRRVLLVCFAIANTCCVFASDTCDPYNPPGPRDVRNPNLNLKEEAGAAGCLPGMARVESFCVDRYEGSLLALGQYGVEAPWSPYHNPQGQVVRAVSIRGAVPQGYISGEQAERACQNSGKRLCTDVEWKRACRGSSNWQFPYGRLRYPQGSSPEKPLCNESRTLHPALELFPNEKDPFSHLENACINQLTHGLARSGDYADCVTPEGVYDIMGNLHEWTADHRGTFRGGFYVDTRINGNGCDYVTTAHDFEYWDYSTGFRCCADLSEI